MGGRSPEYADRKSGLPPHDSPISRLPPPASDAKRSTLDAGLSTHTDQLPTPNSQSLIFDFRLFELPDNQNREATAWCALAGGQPLTDTNEWGRESISRDTSAYYFWSRAVQIRQILHTAQNRLPVRREKQFVRYSASLKSDWRFTIETVNAFGPAWLSAEQH